MTRIRFFTDEDVYAAVAQSLHQAGWDALSRPQAGWVGESDEPQLTFAATEGRVLVTFNVAHFSQLHSTWLAAGHHHAGIVKDGICPNCMADLIEESLPSFSYRLNRREGKK
jgi:hypothetical protein